MTIPTSALRAILLLGVGIASAAMGQSARPPQAIRVTAYNIDLVLDPPHHSMTAHTTVTFTALENVREISFQLDPALHVSGITDGDGKTISADPASTNHGELRIALPSPLKQGEAATWTFAYSGVFEPPASENASRRAQSDVRLAAIGDPVSYLLYAARWFPTGETLTDRFTAAVHVHLPPGQIVFGSGPVGPPHADEKGLVVFDFMWPYPGFPGTILAGKFLAPQSSKAGSKMRVYRIAGKGESAETSKYAAVADREYSYFRSQFGPLDSPALNIVELPDETVPAYSAPEIAAIRGREMQGETSSRLLSNTIAQQWWGQAVSPATRADAWITNGMARLAELEYLEHTADHAVFEDAILNVSASALAYDAVPLSAVARYPAFSPEYQAMTYDKGAMILRMLQWQIGETAFHDVLAEIRSRADHMISSAEFERIATAASKQNLRPFFAQWLESTGAPTLKDNWTLYRLGSNKGFRTMGEIDEDLDLFRMPVDIRVETEGKTVSQRIEVAGPRTQFAIDTFGVPRKISLDPDRWLLRNDAAMQVRVHILRGREKAAKKDFAGAIKQYRQALAIDNISSLASYRMGEVYFLQRNYQAAENAFRDALHGDGLPAWIEVWSDVRLGEIFDVSGQRERAVNEYSEALETRDNTGDALDLARNYLQRAFVQPKAKK